jgi:hypothetical protein
VDKAQNKLAELRQRISELIARGESI